MKTESRQRVRTAVRNSVKVSPDRRLFLAGITANGAASFLPAPARAQACNPIERLLAAAASDYDNPATWAITLKPTVVAELQQKVIQARRDVAAMTGTVSANRRKQLLAYAEGIGGVAVLLTGIALGLGPGIIAGIALSGSLLIARSVAIPGRIEPIDFANNVAGSRIPILIEAFGESTVVLSRNAARYGQAAGALTSLAFVAYSFVDFAQRTETFQASTRLLQELKAELEKAEQQLQGLTNQLQLQRMRRDCALAVIEELTPLACRDPG